MQRILTWPNTTRLAERRPLWPVTAMMLPLLPVWLICDACGRVGLRLHD